MAVPLRVLPTGPCLPHHLFCETAEQEPHQVRLGWTVCRPLV